MRNEEVDKTIKRLEEYVEVDNYANGNWDVETDFDKFCYNHCLDITKILAYVFELEDKVENYMKLSVSSLAKGLNESIKNKEKNKTDLELLNEGWKQTIRDKIKELEENIEESKRMIKNATEEDEKIWWQEELRKCVTGKVYLKELL